MPNATSSLPMQKDMPSSEVAASLSRIFPSVFPRMRFVLYLGIFLSAGHFNLWAAPPTPSAKPLVCTADLDQNESIEIELCDGTKTRLTLRELQETHDPLRHAVRNARVLVEIDGRKVWLTSANYHLPITVDKVQIDCPITKGLMTNSKTDAWGLQKDARLRVWPVGSPLFGPGKFVYPLAQRWFASSSQMANEVCYTNSAEKPQEGQIYYHWGLDFGGAENMVEVVAATDSLVVSAGKASLPDYDDTPVTPRYDVVYLLDEQGWYYRYSHLHSIDQGIQPGAKVKAGQRLGLLGKEGASGGWSHLHFEIASRQPSGKWGCQEAYAFAWEAYRQQYDPQLIANARPHSYIAAGEKITLDGSKSWSADAKIVRYQWTFTDGAHAEGAKVERQYEQPGYYSEVLKVTDATGRSDYDFAVVVVADRNHLDQLPPAMHVVYQPTFDVDIGDEVTFKARMFGDTQGEETWDFGDGSPPATTASNRNADSHAPDGYAVVIHRYQRPGDYLVRVERKNQRGWPAVGYVHVPVYDAGNLLPRPRRIEPVAEDYILIPETSITVSGPDLARCRFIGQRLSQLIEEEFGVRTKIVAQQTAHGWQLYIGQIAEPLRDTDGLAAEATAENVERYRLSVDARGSRASAASAQGLLWAAMTFRQLLVKRGETLAATGVQIDDWPRYRWRGFMIDSGRAPNSLAQMKRIVRICSAFKLNFVVFREGDDELAAVRYQTNNLGRENPYALSMEEVKEFVSYCEPLGIAVVPEIESLGHSAAKGFAYPGLAIGGRKTQYPGIGYHIRKAHLNPDDPRTLTLLESIYGEWIPLLNCPFIHLGLDEVRLPMKSQARHMSQLLPLVERVAQRSGRKITPLVWADAPPTPEGYRRSVIRVPWSYDGQEEVSLDNQHLSKQRIRELCADDCPEQVIMAGGSNSEHTPYSKSGYEGAFRNLAEWARFGEARNNFIGLLTVQWGGNMLDEWVPDFLAGADMAWTPPSEMPAFASQLTRVRANLARLADSARPAPGEVDRPAWDGIWLKGRAWDQEVLKTRPAEPH